MWGIIPAAGAGSRIQPLAFSKELLPVGCRIDDGVERPRAVSEYIIDRMLVAGADKICIVISPGKSDILAYFGSGVGRADFAYVVQPRPAGLCDALFCALPFIAPEEEVVIGLPDTIWYPRDGLALLPERTLSFLLFPVERPEFFDAVVTEDSGHVREIQVKRPDPASSWIWGAIRMPGFILRELHDLWEARGRSDEFLGTLVNAYLARGGTAHGLRAGRSYVDIGTLNGYRHAVQLLAAADLAEELPAREQSSNDPPSAAQPPRPQRRPVPIRRTEPILKDGPWDELAAKPKQQDELTKAE